MLNDRFAAGNIDQATLEALVNDIAATRAKLRIAHLLAHLQTPKVLSAMQITRYNALRGYAGEPCENIPEGHNAEMWKKHNGCK